MASDLAYKNKDGPRINSKDSPTKNTCGEKLMKASLNLKVRLCVKHSTLDNKNNANNLLLS